MANEIKLSDWIKRFNQGDFAINDAKTQIEAGWFDWFCKDTSLANKTKRMGSIIKQIKDGGKINLEDSYVWFKNNCPLVGPLYDDFRIADIDSGTTLMVIQIDDARNEKKYVVFERLNHFERSIFESDSSRALVKWLNEGWK
jgi:hypothetical protein